MSETKGNQHQQKNNFPVFQVGDLVYVAPYKWTSDKEAESIGFFGVGEVIEIGRVTYTIRLLRKNIIISAIITRLHKATPEELFEV